MSYFQRPWAYFMIDHEIFNRCKKHTGKFAIIARTNEVCFKISETDDIQLLITKVFDEGISSFSFRMINSHNIMYYPKTDVESRWDCVFVECFDGRIIFGNPFDLTSPNFLNARIKNPYFESSADEYIKQHNVCFGFDERSAQLKETVEHLQFVAAQRHFMNVIGLNKLI